MITELTTEQKAAIPAHVEKWKKIALSTDPINFELAKEYVIKLYELSGLKQPERIMKVSSPLKIKNVVNSVIGDTVNSRIDYEVTSAVENLVNSEVNIGVREIREIIDNDRVYYDLVYNAIFDLIYNAASAFHYTYYVYHSFFRDVLNIKLPEIYNISEQLTINSSFCLLYKNTVYICERPKSINIQTINNRIRLHNNSGPASHWRDDYKQWYIEGVRVNEQIVMSPETQTLEQIHEEEHEERRRIRIERYGWIQYLEHSKAKLINSRINERDNQQEQLYEHELTNRFICVDPSTGRKYAIAVPQTIKTCLEAQKYLSHGLDEFAIHRS